MPDKSDLGPRPAENPESHILENQWSARLDGQRFAIEELTRLAGNLGGVSTKAPAFAQKRAVHAASDATSDDISTHLEPVANQSPVTPPRAELMRGPEAHRRSSARYEQMPIPRIPAIPELVRRHGPAAESIADREGDLSILSANIERILDEEARRHGIDV
jgi:hypothetical protein